MGAVRDHQSVWLGEALQPCRQVGCLTDYPTLLRLARTNEVTHDHKASRYPNADLKRHIGLGLDLAYRPYCLD